VPRDSTATKERLLREASRLFARHGVWQVTVREITQVAGQRNVSALNYHFGSREGVLDAILTRHGDPTDAARGEHLAAVGRDAPTAELVRALVVPFASHLGTEEGREYLRIVAQLTQQFATWRAGAPGTGPHLIEILEILESRPPELAEAVRRERVVEMIMLMTAATAERARAIDSGRPVELDEATFVANLTSVLVGILEAPLSVETLAR
jgi:TetR/AcrR family transcriptional regulator, regulator of cefoperazone and chloramphenicol sensitivity